jgi:hypothetical protein
VSATNVQKSIFITAPPNTVYAEISEPNNFIGLQPLIVEVSPITRGQDSDGNIVLSYQSVELFRFGGILPYRNKIHVQSTLYPERMAMTSHVKSPFNVQVQFDYHLSAVEQGTQVDLAISFTAPVMIREYVLSQINSAQDAVLNTLKARLEART